MQRRFEPVVLSTKEELLLALRKGDIKTSKYNSLNEEHKLFVEMIVFGGYTAIDAIKVIRPKSKNYKSMANRWTALPNISETIEELSRSKDRKFMAEISNARDMALGKLLFIMNTTEDASLAAVCAKTILDKAEKATAPNEEKDTAVQGFKFAIELAKEVSRSSDYHGESQMDPPAEPEPIIIEAVERGNNGLVYAMNYEEVDNYTEKESD